MLIDNEIKDDVYIKLMNYIFDKCEIFSLFNLGDYHAKSTKKSLDIIFSTENYTVDDIMKNYSDEFLNMVYEKFKDNEQIFDKPRFFNSKIEEENYKRAFTSNKIKIFYYNQIKTKWLQDNKDSMIYNQKKYYYTDDDGIDYYSDIYYFHLTSKFRQEIISKKSIYNWQYPNSLLEDICFFKSNGDCWLKSVAHENLCWINCESKEEYEYLKSIGIKFHDKEFKPIKMDKWKYNDGNKQ